MNHFLLALIGGLAVGLFTVAGSLLGYVGMRAERTKAFLSLDFALGMMVAAAGVSMIWPSALSVAQGASGEQLAFLLSLALGWAFIQGVGGVLEARNPGNRAWLFVVAMCLHNIPEGVASGVGLSELGLSQSIPLLSVIGIQNLPEGALCLLAFTALGFSPRTALLAAAATGFFEFLGGVGAGVAVQFFHATTPYILGFAGSAMLVVSAREIRERFGKERPTQVLSQTAVGFLAMILFNTLLTA